MVKFYYSHNIKIDERLKDEILKEFAGQSVRYHYEVANEVWVNAAKLAEQVQFLSKEFLKRYGHFLPRERVTIVDEEGIEHKSGWCYPIHRILRMVHDGEINVLRKLMVSTEMLIKYLCIIIRKGSCIYSTTKGLLCAGISYWVSEKYLWFHL